MKTYSGEIENLMRLLDSDEPKLHKLGVQIASNYEAQFNDQVGCSIQIYIRYFLWLKNQQERVCLKLLCSGLLMSISIDLLTFAFPKNVHAQAGSC